MLARRGRQHPLAVVARFLFDLVLVDSELLASSIQELARDTAEKPFKGIRFHDLRHCSVTMLSEASVSDATLMSISGHLSRRMVEHYSHIRMEAKKAAISHLPSGIFAAGNDDKPESTEKVQ